MARQKSRFVRKKTKKQYKRYTIYDTPQRAKVQGANEYCRAKGIEEDSRDIFKFFGVKERPGYKFIEPGAPSRTRHNQDLIETRGRKHKMTGAQVAQASQLLEDSDLGMEAKGMNWYAVIWELDLDIKSPHTIRDTMSEAFDYGKYKASLKSFMDQRSQDDRVNWADVTLLHRPKSEDFHDIRYSDEFHAGYGPEGQLTIIRRRGTGMRYRADNVQHRDPPSEKIRHRVHGWAAVGWNFKTPKIIWYKVPSNTNGVITMKVYVDQILEVEVKKWVQRGDKFVLEQDGASGHGGSGGDLARKNNIVAKWFKKMGVEVFYNCHNAPDLAPIENCWQGPKQYASKRPHWDENSLKELLQEGWDAISQKYINKQIDSMPQRLRDVQALKGRMTAW